MTSFDPDAETKSAAESEADTSSDAGAAAPAERTDVGNGSTRVVSDMPAEEVDSATSKLTRPDANSPDAAQTGAPAEAPADGAVEGAGELDTVRQAAAENYDRFLRLQAEFENYKKRSAKEHADSMRYALTPLITEVAAIMDNLERAVEHARTDTNESTDALRAGIEMVVKQMQDALGRFGVTRIEAVGKPFDPSLHDAMTVVERDDVPENQVLDEFQAGYCLHERVIRPARVSVSKRGEVSADSGDGATPEA